MQETGISAERCLDCSMRRAIAESSLHLDAMEGAIEPASAGDAVALKEFTENARAYIGVLLEYMARQEGCLFPTIAQALPEVDKARLSTALDGTYGDGKDDCACNTYIDLANRLADHFDVPRAVIVGDSSNQGGKEGWNGLIRQSRPIFE